MLERLKSLVLALLICALVLQLAISLNMGVQGEITLPGQITALFSPRPETTPLPERVTPQIGAWPSQLAVVMEEGVYSPWGAEEYEALYSQTLDLFEEALGSSRDRAEITLASYLRLLRGPGVFFRYEVGLPLYLHRAWTDSESGSDATTVHSVFLVSLDGAVGLVLSDTESYYLYHTVAAEGDLALLTRGDYSPNAAFAHTLPGFAHLAPDELVWLEEGSLPVYHVARTLADHQELSAEVLESFGFNPNLARNYLNAEGDMIYVDGTRALALRKNGVLEYTNTPEEEDPDRTEDLVAAGISGFESIRRIVTSLWRASGGSDRLSLSLYRYEQGEDTWYFGFDMMVGGSPFLPEESVAYATVQNGAITGISVIPCRIERQEETVYLPWYYTAIVAGGRDTRLLLCYQADGQGYIRPALCRISDLGGAQ